MPKFNNVLLRLAREQLSCSQSKIAEKIGVRQAVFSKYENGVIVPPEKIQEKIAEILHYPLSFFQQEMDEIPSGLIHHRKRTALTATLRLKIEAEVRLRLIDVMRMAVDQKIQSNILSRDSRTPQEMAIAIRRHWRISTGPISNLVEIMENNGIVIIYYDFYTDLIDGFYLRLPTGQICVALNANKAFSPDRNRFTLAHELGHALLHKNTLPDKATEREADDFASELLLPAAEIRQPLTPPLTFTRLLELKKIWKVSIGALIYRANRLGTITAFTYRKLWTYMSSCGYRKKEPNCGIIRETPCLLDEMLKQQQKKTPDLCSFFHLKPDILKARYPQV